MADNPENSVTLGISSIEIKWDKRDKNTPQAFLTITLSPGVVTPPNSDTNDSATINDVATISIDTSYYQIPQNLAQVTLSRSSPDALKRNKFGTLEALNFIGVNSVSAGNITFTQGGEDPPSNVNVLYSDAIPIDQMEFFKNYSLDDTVITFSTPTSVTTPPAAIVWSIQPNVPAETPPPLPSSGDYVAYGLENIDWTIPQKGSSGNNTLEIQFSLLKGDTTEPISNSTTGVWIIGANLTIGPSATTVEGKKTKSPNFPDNFVNARSNAIMNFPAGTVTSLGNDEYSIVLDFTNTGPYYLRSAFPNGLTSFTLSGAESGVSVQSAGYVILGPMIANGHHPCPNCKPGPDVKPWTPITIVAKPNNNNNGGNNKKGLTTTDYWIIGGVIFLILLILIGVGIYFATKPKAKPISPKQTTVRRTTGTTSGKTVGTTTGTATRSALASSAVGK